MLHSLLKSLFLYFAFAASVVVLAAPAHQDQTKAHARGVSRRENQLLSHPRAAAAVANLGSRRFRGASNAFGKRVTNAMRFSEGLPPLPPRKLYKGTRAGSAHQARSSLVPLEVPFIRVYGEEGLSGDALGWVSRDPHSDGVYYFTRECVQIGAQLVSGALYNPRLPNEYPNIGFTGYDVDFTAENGGYLLMTGTASTPIGSSPVDSTEHSINPGEGMWMESNVWTLGADNELIPTWIDFNGEPARTDIAYVPDLNDWIMLSGSISSFNAWIGGGQATKIRLYANGRGCQH